VDNTTPRKEPPVRLDQRDDGRVVEIVSSVADAPLDDPKRNRRFLSFYQVIIIPMANRRSSAKDCEDLHRAQVE
jgi:hypothetical protein